MNDSIKAIKELSQKNKGEAIFRPSSIDRVMNCPGSVRLGVHSPFPQRNTEAQAEGTVAHSIAESVLRGSRSLESWNSEVVTEKGFPIFVDAIMIKGVQLYIDTVKSFCSSNSKLLIEQKLSMENIDKTDDIWKENRGTCDAVVLDYKNKELTIIDLKYGKNYMVKGDSPQLRDYLAMALSIYKMPPGGWSKLRTVIVQPRALDYHKRIKPVEHDIIDVMEFTGKLYSAFVKALEPTPILKEGSWCFWCNGKTICPLLKEKELNLVKNSFISTPITTAHKIDSSSKAGNIPPVTALTKNEIAAILFRKPIYEAFLADVEKEAIILLAAGEEIPGYHIEMEYNFPRWNRGKNFVSKKLDELKVPEHRYLTERRLTTPWKLQEFLSMNQIKALLPLIDESEKGYRLVSGDDTANVVGSVSPVTT